MINPRLTRNEHKATWGSLFLALDFAVIRATPRIVENRLFAMRALSREHDEIIRKFERDNANTNSHRGYPGSPSARLNSNR